MAKNMKRILAMLLVMVMFVSVLPMQALAAEEDSSITVTETMTGGEVTITFTPTENSGESSVVVSGTNESGAAVDLTGTSTTTSNSTTDSQGNITEVTSTNTVLTGKETPADGSVEDGIKVDYQDGTTTTTVTDANGNLVSEHVVNSGSETKEWTEEDSGDEAGQPEVEADLIPGKTTEGTVKTETKDGQTTITVTDRTLTTETSDLEIKVNDSADGLVGEQDTALKGLDPVYDETDEAIRGSNGKILDSSGKDGVFDRNYLSSDSKYNDPTKWTDIPEEGEYRYVGTGEHSKYFAGLVKIIYEKDEAGNTIYDENGNPIVKSIVNNVSGDAQTSNGVPITEIVPEYTIDGGFSGSRAQNFMLMDKNGNKVYAYCCDAQTGAVQGKWYSVSNLEDSEYYTPEAEDHIRSIVMNGYWGTSDVAKEDGTYETGSLESIKFKMLAAIENGDIERYVQVPVRDTTTEGAGKIQVDENGNPIYHEEKMDLMAIIAGMTAGEALLATQAAIWSYANGGPNNAMSGVDGAAVVTPDWYRNHQIGYGKVEGEPLDDAAGARVAALYSWLLNLDTEESSTVIINEKNFVEDMSITVHDKDADHANNKDDNKDNDVYNTDLNFKLAFIPSGKDDLLVQITYTDLEGNPVNVIRRLAGENAEGQSYETILPEEDGSYVLQGLKLSENKDFNFDLRLEGTQYLENGVYVYKAVGGRDVSQTFVGIAQGERNVDISAGMTIKFDVDENNHVVAKREWRDEYDPSYPPEVPNDPPVVWNRPPVTQLANDEVEIPEEPVPLAAPVTTGDTTSLWIIAMMVIVCGMVVVNVFDKKRNYEAF